MNDNEFRYARKIYHKKMKEKEYYLEQKKRLEELLHTSLGKEYIETLQYLISNERKNIDEKWISFDSFSKYASKTKNPKNIYVYTYKNAVTIFDENKVLLRNLETCRVIQVPIEKFEEFKRDNDVIYIENYKNMSAFDLDMKFYEIRDEYLSSLGKLNQEQARERILKR